MITYKLISYLTTHTMKYKPNMRPLNQLIDYVYEPFEYAEFVCNLFTFGTYDHTHLALHLVHQSSPHTYDNYVLKIRGRVNLDDVHMIIDMFRLTFIRDYNKSRRRKNLVNYFKHQFSV